MSKFNIIMHFFERINDRKRRGYHNTHFAFSNYYYYQNYFDLEDVMNELKLKGYMVRVEDFKHFKQIIVSW